MAHRVYSYAATADDKHNRPGSAINRGVATGWTGVDMSTPLLPEVVPKIDANPVSFYSGGGGLGYHNYLGFREFANMENTANFLLPLDSKS